MSRLQFHQQVKLHVPVLHRLDLASWLYFEGIQEGSPLYLPQDHRTRGLCDIGCFRYCQTLTGVETAFGVFGCYSWLLTKALNIVAFIHGSTALAASSVAEAFHLFDVSNLTPLTHVLDGFHRSIICHTPRTHKDVCRINLGILKLKPRQ